MSILEKRTTCMFKLTLINRYLIHTYVPKYQTLEEIMVKSFQVGCACNICGPDYAGPDVQGQTFKLLPSIHNGVKACLKPNSYAHTISQHSHRYVFCTLYTREQQNEGIGKE